MAEDGLESFPLCFNGFDGFGISVFGGVTLGEVHIVGDIKREMEVNESQVSWRNSSDEPCGAVDIQVKGGA